ncbi:type I-E CRISPR-associated protein Cse2/CasB, partial [Streptomyces sp. SID1034]|uniref:type I-E CRISPR-associated protein Cse2/CasB n=1 Tax=Streptomyces sp. SID1034 TaxID=2690248 RepID=UPI0013691875
AEADTPDTAEADTPDTGGPQRRAQTRPNLGASLADAVNRGLFKPGSAEADLHLMARQSSDSLHQRLPSLTQRILKGGVPLDWAVLLNDLAWWNHRRDQIATRWLESYFRVRTTEDDTTQPKESH